MNCFFEKIFFRNIKIFILYATDCKLYYEGFLTGMYAIIMYFRGFFCFICVFFSYCMYYDMSFHCFVSILCTLRHYLRKFLFTMVFLYLVLWKHIELHDVPLKVLVLWMQYILLIKWLILILNGWDIIWAHEHIPIK